MEEPIGEHNIHELVTAFADGELDDSTILTVLEYLAAHPEGLELMRNQQRLRMAAGRAVRTQTPPVSAALRQRIGGLATAVPEAPAPRRSSRWLTRWRVLTVAAACLAAGMLAGRWLPVAAPPPQVVITPPRKSVVPVTLVAEASRIHGECSRLAEGLHTAGYPKEMGRLKQAVRDDLDSRNPYPDLSAIGFWFTGVGPCRAPLADTIHLHYRARGGFHPKTLSVFVQLYSGQVELEPGKLYLLSGPRSPFPMLAWRTESVVYYLVADDLDTAQRARELISVAPSPPLIQD